MDLYSALFVVPHTQGPQAWITQFYLQITPCLLLPRKHSPDGAITDLWMSALPLFAADKPNELGR